MAHGTLHQMLFALCEFVFCPNISMFFEKIVKQNLTQGSNFNSMFQALGLKRDHNILYIQIYHGMMLYRTCCQKDTQS